MRAVSVIALLAMGCGEQAIELHLIASTGDVANTDLSCVNSVHIILHNGSSDFGTIPQACITVESPTSYADLEAQIRGKFQMELPEDIVAVEIRGQGFATKGDGFCGSGMNVFYAGEEYTGGDMSLRVEGTIDCSAIKNTGELKVRPIDLVALACGVVASTRADPRWASITFTCTESGEASMTGVSARIETALRNLVDNAASFAQSKVDVRVVAGDTVTIEVTDDGPGIAADELPRVFDRFHSKRQHGTGLGLALVRAIAEAHDGTASVGQGPERGSTFVLELPR